MIDTLAEKIVNYSLKVNKNDKVLITGYDNAIDLILKLVEKIIEVGGVPNVKLKNNLIDRLILQKSKINRVELVKELTYREAITYDCFINIKYGTNDFESKSDNKELRRAIGDATSEADDIRVNEKRWVLLNYPSYLDAHKSKMPYNEYYKYSMEAMIFNYNEMLKDIEPLKKLMENTDKVRIVNDNTDLTFSIKGMPIVPCAGECNLPDGEIYTAPIKESVEGYITFNTPCPYHGNIFNDVRLEFSKGKIINALSSEDGEHLNEIFDTDSGSRYIGEFSLGLNPYIRKPIGDILYDEKIIGSIHLTPGNAYKDAFNGNVSAVHWDMVLLNPDIYFDDVLIRKEGKFILEELKHLNYE